MSNIILDTDSYKVSHRSQYPQGTKYIYSYLESRSQDETIVNFGLQYILKKYLVGRVLTKEMIDEAEELLNLHFGPSLPFPRQQWERLLKEYDGKLPIQIKALPEGALVKSGIPLLTVENTDHRFFWLTNYVETLLSRIWYPMTVASYSWRCKQVIKEYLEKTADNLDGLLFKLHDFGFRGVSSKESAGIGGCAHLVNFMGTDTLEALIVARKYYRENCAGFSIPASEHSTITSWGQENEVKAFENMLTIYPNGLVACVSDSYNIYDACDKLWGELLKNKIQSRNGTLVIRPDSGDPTKVLPKIFEILFARFGYKINSKGYRMLPDCLRVIQGDGISLESIGQILSVLEYHRISADNIAFGSGGKLLQDHTRDRFKFAFKCSAINIDYQWQDVFKDPVTDKGKQSKKGRFIVLPSGKIVNQEKAEQEELAMNRLAIIFNDGDLVADTSLALIRGNADYINPWRIGV